MEEPFVISNNKIYHQPSCTQIYSPTVLFDAKTYTVFKIGNYSLCHDYYNLMASRMFPMLDDISFFSFNTEDLAKTCSEMNNVINITGYIETLLKK